MHAKVENPPKISKSANRKWCRKVSIRNNRKPDLWAQRVRLGEENDWLVAYGNGLVVYGKQKRQTHC